MTDLEAKLAAAEARLADTERVLQRTNDRANARVAALEAEVARLRSVLTALLEYQPGIVDDVGEGVAWQNARAAVEPVTGC